jgi:hypothetical protein
MGEALASAARSRTHVTGARDLEHVVDFRQSHRTAQMIDQYVRAIAR